MQERRAILFLAACGVLYEFAAAVDELAITVYLEAHEQSTGFSQYGAVPL